MDSRSLPSLDRIEDTDALHEMLERCDGKTFVALNDLYAKDMDSVYFRPQLVNHFDVLIVEGADPESFQVVERCSPGHGLDSKHVYYMGEIEEDKDPEVFARWDANNAATWCY